MITSQFARSAIATAKTVVLILIAMFIAAFLAAIVKDVFNIGGLP